MQKYINKFMKCLSKDNNMFKVAACAVIGWMVFLVVLKVVMEMYAMLKVREGFEPASEILLLHMKGCPHCTKFIPEWEKFVSKNKSGIKARAIERQENPALMKKHNVTGFPTVLLVDSKGDKVKEYKGPRTTEGLLSFCKGN
jgi:thiol-disulfide isomerase/thioredoxin